MIFTESYPCPERSSRGQAPSVPQSLKPICQVPHAVSDPKFDNLLHSLESSLNWLLFVFSGGPTLSLFAKALKLLSLFLTMPSFEKQYLPQAGAPTMPLLSPWSWTRQRFVFKVSGQSKTPSLQWHFLVCLTLSLRGLICIVCLLAGFLLQK